MKNAQSLLGAGFARIVAGVVCLSGVVAGCGLPGTGASSEPPLGEIRVALTQVPADVACVELTVAGSSTVTQLFDVTAGAATTLSMGGLPVGTVAVTETAFSVPCAQVTPTTPPSWISTMPASATLTAGATADVTIVMRRAAQLQVTSDFQDTVASVTVSPASQDFGSVAVGQTGAATFTVTNASTTDVPFGVTFTGTGASQFGTIGGSCGGVATLPAAQSCTLVVSFAPTSTGTASATMSIGAPAVAMVALAGTGTPGSAVTISAPKPTMKTGFAGATLGTSTSATIQVTNGGTTAVPWAAALTGPDAPNFALSGGTCQGLASLGAGASCTLGITFTPFTVGPKLVTLAIGNPVVATSVISTTAGVGGAITISPASNDFGTVPLGQPAGAVFMVSNVSTESFQGLVSVIGPDAAMFSAFGGTCGGIPTLAPGDTCTIELKFAPTSMGAKVATLIVGSPAQGAATLAGTGSGGSTAVTISQPNSTMKTGFASALLGTSTTALITVSNGGTTALPWAAALTGPDVASFVLTGGTCPALTTLAAGASCTLGITFTPFTIGTKVVTLTVGNPVVASSLISTSAGIAGEISFSPPSDDFGSVPVGQAAAVLLTATNISTDDFTGSVGFIGPDAAQFSIFGGTCRGVNVLTAGASCTLAVRFAPTSTGAKVATIIYGTTAAQGFAPLTGTATAGTTAVAISPINSAVKGGFTSALVGSSTSASITVANTGTTGVPFAAAFTGPDASSVSITGGTCAGVATLAAATSCTLAIKFAPFTIGIKVVTLAIGNPVVASAVYSVLVGTGGNFALSPAAATFATVPVGSSSTATFTVLNVATAAEPFSTGFLGPDASQFAVAGGTCGPLATLAMGASCTVQVRFSPTSTGVKNAGLVISGNQGAASLTGSGM